MLILKKHIDRVQQCLKLARNKGASSDELNHGTSAYSAAGRLKIRLERIPCHNIEVIVKGHRGS